MDSQGMEFRAFFVRQIRVLGDEKIKATLTNVKPPHDMPVQTRRSRESSILIQVEQYILGNCYIHELVFELFKVVFPFLTLTIVAPAGVESTALRCMAAGVFDRECNVVHIPANDIFPQNSAGLLLGVVLHFLEGGGSDGDLNHYEVADMVHMDSKMIHWLGGQKESRQTSIKGFFAKQPQDKRVLCDTVLCSKCGESGLAGFQVFPCTAEGCTQTASQSACYSHLGMTEPVQCENAATRKWSNQCTTI